MSGWPCSADCASVHPTIEKAASALLLLVSDNDTFPTPVQSPNDAPFRPVRSAFAWPHGILADKAMLGSQQNGSVEAFSFPQDRMKAACRGQTPAHWTCFKAGDHDKRGNARILRMD